jgi:hypothetical protein
VKRDNPDQSRAFIEKAKEIGADEDTSRADDVMNRMVRTPTTPHKPVAKRPKR